jgi:hypothetical protein
MPLSMFPPEILLLVFAYLPLKDLFAVKQTNSRFSRLVPIEIGLRIHARLRPYTQKVDEFLTVLGHCNGIITGSVALHVALSQTRYTENWNPSDVDVHLPLSTYSFFLQYLMREENYFITESPVSTSHTMGYIFSHRLKNDERNVYIDLACSNEESAIHLQRCRSSGVHTFSII